MHPACVQGCVDGDGKSTVCLPGGRVAPCLLSIHHNTPVAWGQAPLLAGVTDITLTGNDHSSAVPPTPAEPALQICTPSTPSFPSTVHLSPGKCPGNVLLRFLGTNSTTERGIMARGLKFSFGKYQSVVLPLSTGISWHIMVGAVWGWGVNLTGGLLPALCYYPLPRGSPRSGRPPSCVTFWPANPPKPAQLVASAKVPLIKIGGLPSLLFGCLWWMI